VKLVIFFWVSFDIFHGKGARDQGSGKERFILERVKWFEAPA
jgi:hypothetical protein